MDHVPSLQLQLPDAVHSRSLENPAGFWSQEAERLSWDQKPKAVLHTWRKMLKSGTVHPTWDWFPGGEISTCYNCVDRHVEAGCRDRVALYYDSPVTNSKESFTYSRLLGEVETLAGALREKGVRKGGIVMLYMPMIPSALVGMLAVNRLGAIHSVVNGAGTGGCQAAAHVDEVHGVSVFDGPRVLEGVPKVGYAVGFARKQFALDAAAKVDVLLSP